MGTRGPDGPGGANIAPAPGPAQAVLETARSQIARKSAGGDAASGRPGAELCTVCARRLWRQRRGVRGGHPAVAAPRGRLSCRPRAHPARRPFPPYEAHLPAQEAQARPHPRLPCAHEHARRPLVLKRRRDKGRKRLTVCEPSARPAGGPRSGAGCRAAPSSSASTARAARRRTASSCSTRSRARRSAGRGRGRRPAARPLGVAPCRRRRRPHAREARAARGVLGRGRAPAAGSDYVVVARPDARELAEREGMAGVRARARRARRPAGRGSGAAA